jgi:hypothetical protein
MCFDLNGNAIFPVFSAKLHEQYGIADRLAPYLVKRERGANPDWHKLHITPPDNWTSVWGSTRTGGAPVSGNAL